MSLSKLMDNVLDGPGIKGVLGTVIFIAVLLIVSPDNTDFAVELANHLPYFTVYMIGMMFLDILSYIMEKMRRRKSNNLPTSISKGT